MSDHTFEKDGKKYRFSNAWHDRPFSDTPCPRCDHYYNSYPARSRRDNETAICSDCGREEAYEDLGTGSYEGTPYWKQA